MDKISVIIPVYNVSRYVDECLESVRKQSYQNIEVIIVEDLSSDSSYEQIRKFCERDKRFVCYRNNENRGPSYSRNFGLSKSTGRFIFFLDSDDVLSTNCLMKLCSLLKSNNGDVAICNYQIFDQNYVVDLKEPEISILNNFEIMTEIASCTKIQNFAWGKLFKREVLNENLFPVGKVFEDIYPISITLSKTNTVVYTNEKLYYYRKNDNSLSRKFDCQKIDDYLLALAQKGLFLDEKYPTLSHLMAKSFFNAFYLIKKIKINRNALKEYNISKNIYKKIVRKATIKEKIKYWLAVI